MTKLEALSPEEERNSTAPIRCPRLYETGGLLELLREEQKESEDDSASNLSSSQDSQIQEACLNFQSAGAGAANMVVAQFLTTH